MDKKDTDRLGSLDPTSLSGESKQLYDDIDQFFDVNYVYKLADGRMVGPFGIELHTPGAGYAWLGMTKSLAKIPGLPPLAREVAILVTGTHEKAAYEVYAHSAVSQLPKQDLDQIMQGNCPAHLDEKCQIAFSVATELCITPGPLASSAWHDAVSILGVSGATALVHYVGFYKYVATILNGFDAQVPVAT